MLGTPAGLALLGEDSLAPPSKVIFRCLVYVVVVSFISCVLGVGPGQHELHSHAHTREETEVEDEQWTRVLLATNAPAAGRPVCWLY